MVIIGGDWNVRECMHDAAISSVIDKYGIRCTNGEPFLSFAAQHEPFITKTSGV